MKLYFVRHGETDWNVQHLTQGWTDIPLNAAGAAQAKKLQSKLAELEVVFDAVYTSPLQRALKTAQIATAEKRPFVIDERLKERGCGDFEGKPRNLILNCNIDFLDPQINSDAYDVEPINHMTDRVRSFLTELKTKYNHDANILVFTSNGVMLRAHIIITGDSEQSHLPVFANAEVYQYEI